MKSISDYLNSSEGTGPANGKRFELYGMYIGRLKGYLMGPKLMFVREDGEIMEVPLTMKELPGFELDGKKLGPIANPVLSCIIEA